MQYEVIKLFTDLDDKRYLYRVGDMYPRDGYSPTESRIAELMGSSNRQGTPLIKAAQTDAESVTEEPKKTRRRRKKSDDE